jgi:hypothetical protein
MEWPVNAVARIGCVAVVLTSWCQPSTAIAAAPTSSTTVVVTVTDTGVKLSRLSIPAGLVVFDVGNRGRHRHRFEIAGNTTPALAFGKTAVLKIVFVRGGSYRFAATGLPGGVLRVSPAPAAGSPAPASSTPVAAAALQPCTNPTTSTVTVTMTDKFVPDGYTFSPPTVPCGTVTFVLTNTGKLGHGLELMDPRGQILPASSTVEPSQTASLVENLGYTGTYEWADVISDAFGEEGVGQLVVR